jgi:hypothetical protein
VPDLNLPRHRGRSPLGFSYLALFSAVSPTDYSPMADLDLRTLSRNILLLVAILSFLVIAEMVLVSAEEPAPSTQSSSQPALRAGQAPPFVSVTSKDGPLILALS